MTNKVNRGKKETVEHANVGDALAAQATGKPVRQAKEREINKIGYVGLRLSKRQIKNYIAGATPGLVVAYGPKDKRTNETRQGQKRGIASYFSELLAVPRHGVGRKKTEAA